MERKYQNTMWTGYVFFLTDECSDGSFFQVEDLKEVVLKLAAADRLRSQGFLRSEQSLPKTNKRGDYEGTSFQG